MVELIFYGIPGPYSIASTAAATQSISSRSAPGQAGLRTSWSLQSATLPGERKTLQRRPRPPDTSGRENPWPGPKSPTGAPDPTGPPPGSPQVVIEHMFCLVRVPRAPRIVVEHIFYEGRLADYMRRCYNLQQPEYYRKYLLLGFFARKHPQEFVESVFYKNARSQGKGNHAQGSAHFS